jgi:hypothetical protein
LLGGALQLALSRRRLLAADLNQTRSERRTFRKDTPTQRFHLGSSKIAKIMLGAALAAPIPLWREPLP